MSSVPINGVWPINCNQELYEAPDGTVWLRTGVIAENVEGEYPNATVTENFLFDPNESDKFEPLSSITRGVCWDGVSFWIIGEDYLVYQYDSSGTPTGASFPLSGIQDYQNGYSFVFDLCWDGSSFYILTRTPDYSVYIEQYTGSGEYEMGIYALNDQLDGDASPSSGITWDGSHLWLVSDFDLQASITEYYIEDGRAVPTGRKFYLDESMEQNYSGLAWDGSSFWSIGNTPMPFSYGKLYRYDIEGNNLSVSETQTNYGESLAWDGESLWVLDVENGYMYEYVYKSYIGTQITDQSDETPDYTRIK